MIKAIIFDCFGVLTTERWIAFKKRHFRYRSDLADKASQTNQLADAGTLTYDQFLLQLAQLAGMTAGDVQKELENNMADEELFEYINTLKLKYKIGMLSNAAGNHLEQLFSQAQIATFDAIVLSYEAGTIKPEPRAYELIAERLGVLTTECVFIDDQQKHCEGAVRAGMVPILYKDFGQLKKELEQILAASSKS